jgi:hypothetical protein
LLGHATYDIRSADLLENSNSKSLEVNGSNSLKPIIIYKILKGHTTPNLKESFRLNNETGNTYNLRNTETDLALPKSKKEFERIILVRFLYHVVL